MSIHKKSDGVFEVRWREGGRNKSLRVHGSHELAKKVLRKKMSVRDENRHLDVKKEVNFRMSALIDRYWTHYGAKKRSANREKSVLDGIRSDLGRRFVREVDGIAVSRWYEDLTVIRNLSPGTAVRHFNVMHHMMAKASTIWSKETGIDRNPADQVEVRRPDDQRDRYLSEDELRRLKQALDDKAYRKGTTKINKTFYRLRLIVLIAVTTGMRASEIFGLRWGDVMYSEGLLAVRAKLKGGKMRYVPMPIELAGELGRFPVVIGEDRIFPPKAGASGGRQRVEGSFEDLLERAKIEGFRFHDLRHTFASWYMMNGGDLYELAKILGHSNIKMTERYAKLARHHIAKTSSTAREIWKLMEQPICGTANVG
ncbi:MAG: site-specific integrase [Bryobacterales bacterium]|nr:site-specific integrase [Bryobacterales bacterium]MBV9400937.1 site-specific integrase [Bryobacterales bacterium]